MKEMILEIVRSHCHLDWFVLSAEFDMHLARAEGWLLDHMMMRLGELGMKICGRHQWEWKWVVEKKSVWMKILF